MSYLSRNQARDFLADWGIDIETLHERAPEIADDECLALTGSIVEGLANDESDVDMLYLGNGVLKDKLVMHMDTSFKFGVSHDENGREINVEQLTFADLNDFADRVSRSMECLTDPQKSKEAFAERNESKLKMLHRIKTALPLVNADVLHDWQSRLKLNEFHRFVCLSLVQNLMNQREDIIGEVKAGKIDSAIWMTKCQFAPTLVSSLLASVGETNAHAKWHYQLLRRYEDELGRERVADVLRFVFLPADDLREDLIGKLMSVSEPVVEDIYDRQRLVRRAMIVFALTVRYTDPKNLDRWARSKPLSEA